MDTNKEFDHSREVEIYDDEAEATNWLGPELLFGLCFKYVNAGERILDIGIGTGLSSVLFQKAGLHVFGMDISDDMLEICRKKQITNDLVKHDLMSKPYPYTDNSMDHAICAGVMQFFKDLSPIFREASRILCDNGTFSFVVADRASGENPEILVGHEHTHSDESITMYRHSPEQINLLLEQNGFDLKRQLKFPVQMDREKTKILITRAYVVLKN
nr:class I SAM-dependent methyltransferase [Bacteroidota bacterium]